MHPLTVWASGLRSSLGPEELCQTRVLTEIQRPRGRPLVDQEAVIQFQSKSEIPACFYWDRLLNLRANLQVVR